MIVTFINILDKIVFDLILAKIKSERKWYDSLITFLITCSMKMFNINLMLLLQVSIELS